MKERIRKAVADALEKMGAGEVVFAVEYPADLAHGDFAVNAAMVAAKALGKNPREIGEELAAALRAALAEDAAVKVAGPGFVNVTLSQGALLAELEAALVAGEAWGQGSNHAGEKVMIDYANPNPFKEMHIGHLMSAVVGEALARLTASRGAEVFRASFGGDVGPHVAKALWGLREAGISEPASAAEIGDAYAAGAHEYEENKQVKAEIDQLNVALYDAVAKLPASEPLTEDERQMLETWRIGRDVSMAAFRETFARLGTRLDYDFFDSDTTAPGLRVVRDGLAKGVFEESDGAIIYRGEKKGLHTLVFVTSRGTPTYEAKDIGLAFLKEERWPSDRSLIVSAAEQIGHFKVVLAALEDVAPLLAKKTTHVPHGFLRLTTGKMSSRAGNVITAVELLKDVTAKASEKNPDPLVAEQVAVGAIKYMILRQSPGQDIVFDPEQSLSLDGDSGPYLQYALVRARSVLRAAEEAGKSVTEPLTDEVPEVPYELARLLPRFPAVVARAEALLAPNLLTTYLTELAGAWNSFYASERIVDGEYEAHKLSLARVFAATMQNGLTLLGIPTPKKM